MTSSLLCPHLFRAYLAKASDIIEIYQPQIVSIVRYDSISTGLLHRRVLKRREHKTLLKCPTDDDRMIKLLEILKIRMWGLENLITILLENNVDNWLADELFQAYVRHLVANMRQIQNKKLCDCVQTGDLSLLQCSWFVVFEKLDAWLLNIGNSLGYLAIPLHPVQSLLRYIRERLHLKSRTETLKSLLALQCTSDSDESEDGIESPTKAGTTQTNSFRERSASTPSLCPRKLAGKHNGSLRPEAPLNDDLTQSYADVHKFGRSCPDIQELEWDDQADPQFYSALTEDAEYILQLIESSGHASSFSSSLSSSSSRVGVQTGEMASQTTISDTSVPTASIATQTSPPSSPTIQKRSNFLEMKKATLKPASNMRINTKIVLPNNDSALNPKVAEVPPSPRQRVREGYKAKKSSTHPTPSQHHYEDRLKPEDYGKWSKNHLTRSWRNELQNSKGGTNVA